MAGGLGQFEHYQFGFGSVYGSHARSAGGSEGVKSSPWLSPGVGGVGASLSSIRPVTGAILGHPAMRQASSQYGQQMKRRQQNFATGRGVLGVKDGAESRDATSDQATAGPYAQSIRTGAPMPRRPVKPFMDWPQQPAWNAEAPSPEGWQAPQRSMAPKSSWPRPGERAVQGF